ncbi:thiolase family protein [Jannaschia sp. R86511]|uniref:thiolase family protein n=1 Tax=Jannaschia sp. R86511 TaxID=3093853 RepID=UPI0036D3E4A5
MNGREVFLVGGVRTPVGKHRGALSSVRADELAALVVREVIDRAGLTRASQDGVVEEVILGAANQAGEDNRNLARMAVLLAGLPVSTPGYTVNRLCASGLTAVAAAAQAVAAGENDLVVAGGAESMTRAPWALAKPGTPWAEPGEIVDTALGWRFVNPRMPALDEGRATLSLGETAEEVAALDGITREESDSFAERSHRLATAARDAGRFDAEITAVHTSDGRVAQDETVRPGTTLDRLGQLRPVFRADGVVTAGSSSPLADGASAVIVASQEAIERHGLTPRARILGCASAGVRPSLMGLGPVPATQKLLARLGLVVGDLDAVEINEAFAPQVLACIRRLDLDPEPVNADGGAIALGHPLGSSGCRLLVTLLGRLEREGARRGLATLCVGVGQGVALAVERV